MTELMITNGLFSYRFYQICFLVALFGLPIVLLPHVLTCTACALLYIGARRLNENLTRKLMDGKDRGVFITGCDTGFGFYFATHLDSLGFTVFAGCLNSTGAGATKLQTDCSKNLHVIQIDVTIPDDIEKARQYVQTYLPKHGLWGVVNNAGIVMIGEIELIPVSMYEKGFDVNIYGTIRVNKAFLPMIRQSKGVIVNISSVHGRTTVNCYSIYAVAKHLLETYSDSLRLEMRKFGVKVVMIEPGMFAAGTSVLSDAMIERQNKELDIMWDLVSTEQKETYTKAYINSWIRQPVGTNFNAQPDILKPVVKALEHALCSTNPKTRYLVSGVGKMISYVDDYAALVRVQRFLPTWLLDAYIAWWRQCDTQ